MRAVVIVREGSYGQGRDRRCITRTIVEGWVAAGIGERFAGTYGLGPPIRGWIRDDCYCSCGAGNGSRGSYLIAEKVARHT